MVARKEDEVRCPQLRNPPMFVFLSPCRLMYITQDAPLHPCASIVREHASVGADMWWQLLAQYKHRLS